jgi:hypothetical protein
MEKLVGEPTKCLSHFFRPGTIVATDCRNSEWIYIVKSVSVDIQMGPKVTSLVARICVGFADVTRSSGVNLAHMSRKCYAQTSRTMCVMQPAYIMQKLRAPAAQQGMLLLDPSVFDTFILGLQNP